MRIKPAKRQENNCQKGLYLANRCYNYIRNDMFLMHLSGPPAENAEGSGIGEKKTDAVRKFRRGILSHGKTETKDHKYENGKRE